MRRGRVGGGGGAGGRALGVGEENPALRRIWDEPRTTTPPSTCASEFSTSLLITDVTHADVTHADVTLHVPHPVEVKFTCNPVMVVV